MSTSEYTAPERVLVGTDTRIAVWGIDRVYADPMAAITAADAYLASSERTPRSDAAARFVLGTAYAVTGELTLATCHLDEAERIYAIVPDELALAYVTLRRDLIWHQINETDLPIAWFPDAIAVAKRHDDGWLETGLLNDLGLIHLRRGDVAEGVESLFDALGVAERGSDRLQELVIRLNLAAAFMDLHDFELAQIWCQQVLEADVPARAQELRFEALHRLAGCKEHLGASGEALELLRESTALAETLDFSYGIAESSYDVGALQLRLGDREGAAQSFKRAIGRFQQVETPLAEARILMCAWWLERIERSFTSETYQKLVKITESGLVRAYDRAFDLYDALAQSAESLGLFSEALAHMRESRRLSETYWSEIGIKQTRVALKRHQLDAMAREAGREREHREELARALVESQALNAENQHLVELLREQSVVLEQQASEDALTAIGNRRFFNAQLDRALQIAAESQGSISVALADIDNFKEINDRNSHRVGDEVLITVAGILRAVLRQSHVFARYGGEEFAFLFSDVPHDRAVAFAESIRATVETYPWETLAKGLSVTLSIGLASHAGEISESRMLAAADTLLYRAKHGGKNQVQHGFIEDEDEVEARPARAVPEAVS